MKELFVAYSRYNMNVNNEVFAIFHSLDRDQLQTEIKSCFRTIGDILYHVILSDTRWLHRMSRFRKTSIPENPLTEYVMREKCGEHKKEEALDIDTLVKKKSDFAKLRNDIDEEIVQLIQAIPENAFISEMEIPFGSRNITLVLWKLLLQWFNHHTHHRGQITIHLDLLGIDNDYSLMLNKMD